MLEQLTFLDAVVFVMVLAITIGVVVIGNRRQRRLKEQDEAAGMLDLLLMGRRLTLPLFTGTLVATWYGGIIPVTEYAYDYGLYSWLTQGVFWYAAYLIFAACLVKRIRFYEAVTMPDLLSRMFGPRAGSFGAVMNLINVIPLVYIISLGLFLQTLFGGEAIWWMLGGTAVVLGYSLVGGFRSVVLSDMVQFFVMCLAVALVIVFSMLEYGGLGWLKASPNIPQSHWKPLGDGVPLLSTLVWGFVALGTLVDPNFYHRCLAAKDDRTAWKGILLATLIWVGFDFCTTFGAFYARAVLPEVPASSAYLSYGVQVLPAGLKGFFLAGVLATILSTLDSYLFLSGTLVSYDLAPKKWKGRIRVHHIGTLLVSLAAVGLAQLVNDLKLADVWKMVGGFTTACLLFPLMLGLAMPGRVKERAFLISCLSGVVAMLVYYAVHPYLLEFLQESQSSLAGFWEEFDAFYFGVFASMVGMLVGLSGRP